MTGFKKGLNIMITGSPIVYYTDITESLNVYSKWIINFLNLSQKTEKVMLKIWMLSCFSFPIYCFVYCDSPKTVW